MQELPSLEIRVDLQEGNRLYVACAYSDPKSEEVQAKEARGGLFEESEFRKLASDVKGYGRALADMLFAEPPVRTFCEGIFNDAMKAQTVVRVRIAISASALPLNALHWEKLLHPSNDVPLARAQYIVFSRITVQSDWRTTGPRRRDSLSSLLCLADDLKGRDGEPPIFPSFGGTAFEQAAKGYLEGDNLKSIGANYTATRKALRDGLAVGVDVLYAVCHGILDKAGEPKLVLHADDGTPDYLTGTEITQMFRELLVVPRLAVLVSCASAGTGSGDSNAIHIAPRLAEAGVACVIGFNGIIPAQTALDFCRKLFEILRADADIEKAVREARLAMGDDAWWMPVLLTRLRAGALWYRQGFGESSLREDDTRTEFWDDVAESVREHQVTPVIGPDVTTSLLGSRRELALKWAVANGYPLKPGGNDSLPQIAQYLSTMYKRPKPITKAIRYAYDQLISAGATTEDLRNADLTAIIAAINKMVEDRLAAKWGAQDTLEPYRAIADLDANVYVSLDWTDHLLHALRYRNKDPIVIVPWYWQNSQRRSDFSDSVKTSYEKLCENASRKPDARHPVLYYMFGRLAEDYRSIAMSEDDHFDALIELSRDENQFPSSVRSALCGTNLMFIGCNLQEWNFRVMLRLIVTRAGFSPANRDFRHVAANIGPEDSDLSDPQRARRYLAKYLTNSHIDLYSGTATDFMRDLTNNIRPPQRDAA